MTPARDRREVGAVLGDVEAALEQPAPAACDGGRAERDPAGEEEAATVQAGALAVAGAEDLAQPVDHPLVGMRAVSGSAESSAEAGRAA